MSPPDTSNSEVLIDLKICITNKSDKKNETEVLSNHNAQRTKCILVPSPTSTKPTSTTDFTGKSGFTNLGFG